MRMPRGLKFIVLSLLSSLLLIAAGCSQKGGSGGGGGNAAAVGFLRVVNTVEDAPVLTATVGGASAGSVGYRESTALGQQAPATVSVDVTYVDPISAATVKLFTAVSVPLKADHVVSLVLKGTMAAPTSQIVDEAAEKLAATEAQVQFLNASTAGNLAIYLTEVGAALPATPTATLNTGIASTTMKITASNTLRLRVTRAGAAGLIYDSASFPIVAAARRLILVTDSFGPDPASVGTLVLSESATLALPNTVARAGVRVLNAVPDQVSVTETLTDRTAMATIGSANTVLAQNALTALTVLAPTSVSVHTTAASDAALTFDSSVFTLLEDSVQTIVLAGTSISPRRQAAAIITSDRRPVKTNSRLQFINAARASTNTVDVYFVDPAHTLESTTAPALTNLSFLSNGTTLVTPNRFDIYVTTPGSKSVIVGPTRVTTEAGKSYFLVLGESTSGGEPLFLTVIDDTNAIPPAP